MSIVTYTGLDQNSDLLLIMHHPDVNQGSRVAESDLRATIDAHKILKLNGFC